MCVCKKNENVQENNTGASQVQTPFFFLSELPLKSIHP